jgi:uncharacterized damage-inducible protein DinB
VNPDNAKTLAELAQLTQEPAEKLQDLLKSEEASAHVKSLSNEKNERRYYLTGLGILKAISMLT